MDSLCSHASNYLHSMRPILILDLTAFSLCDVGEDFASSSMLSIESGFIESQLLATVVHDYNQSIAVRTEQQIA
jgi:hypothetical protein